jgi:hypothetical protein
MKSLTLITKLLSVSVLVYVFPQVADVWESRSDSIRVRGDELVASAKQLEPVYFPRKELSEDDVDSIASKNLFRKQRSQYVKPVRIKRPKNKEVILKKAPSIIKAPVKEVIPYLPSPKLILEGVVIMPGRSIAILEGKYASPTQKGRHKFLRLKAKRFVLGDMIGAYRITKIEREQVVLSNLEGETLKLNLEK